MKDEKHIFESGASSSEHVPDFGMIPLVLLTRTAKRLQLGEVKHGRWNYRKGLEDKAFLMDRLNHAFLHLKRLYDSIEFDIKTMDDDAAAIVVNIAIIMESQDKLTD